MRKKLLWFLLPVVLVAGAAVLMIARSRPQKITLAMTFVPNVQFAPWYVAEEKGFFREEGLEVEFDYRMDIDALPLTAAGKIDFALAGGDMVITARSQGIPVVYLMCLYAKFPPAVVALAGSGIHTPQDLTGRKIGLPLYGTSLLAMKAILHSSGVAETDVELVDVGYGQISALTEGLVDAVVVFANNETVKLKNMGYEINIIPSWDYFSLVGHGLVTGEKMIAGAPEVVRGMVRASVRGIEYALKHPDEAFEICLKHLPELGEEQKKIEKQVLLASMEIWESDYTREKGLGYSDPGAWRESQDLMAEAGLIQGKTPVEEFLDLTFLP